jgi:hypothetical protein
MRRVTLKAGLISFVVCAMLAGVAPMAAAAASGGLGGAAGFAVLAGGTGALTCTDSTVTGPQAAVGISSSSIGVTQTRCTLGVKVAPGPYADFLKAYGAIADNPTPWCTVLTGTLADVHLLAGTYCFGAAAALTGTLYLDGAGPWLFEIGTGGTGALAATNFNVVGSNPCNATWWVRNGVALTTSAFQGTILGGGAITLTGTTLAGRAFATGALTMTDSSIVGCDKTKGEHGKVGTAHGISGVIPDASGTLVDYTCASVQRTVVPGGWQDKANCVLAAGAVLPAKPMTVSHTLQTYGLPYFCSFNADHTVGYHDYSGAVYNNTIWYSDYTYTVSGGVTYETAAHWTYKLDKNGKVSITAFFPALAIPDPCYG